jgi:uncharacterized protein YpmS
VFCSQNWKWLFLTILSVVVEITVLNTVVRGSASVRMFDFGQRGKYLLIAGV